MVVDEADSVKDTFISIGHAAVVGSFKPVEPLLSEDSVSDQRVSSVASIDAVGQVAQVVLICFKLSNASLIRYV